MNAANEVHTDWNVRLVSAATMRIRNVPMAMYRLHRAIDFVLSQFANCKQTRDSGGNSIFATCFNNLLELMSNILAVGSWKLLSGVHPNCFTIAWDSVGFSNSKEKESAIERVASVPSLWTSHIPYVPLNVFTCGLGLFHFAAVADFPKHRACQFVWVYCTHCSGYDLGKRPGRQRPAAVVVDADKNCNPQSGE